MSPGPLVLVVEIDRASGALSVGGLDAEPALRALGLEPATDLVEALLRAGHSVEAELMLDSIEHQRTIEPVALAAAARCRGLLATGEAVDVCFRRALDLLLTVDAP